MCSTIILRPKATPLEMKCFYEKIHCNIKEQYEQNLYRPSGK